MIRLTKHSSHARSPLLLGLLCFVLLSGCSKGKPIQGSHVSDYVAALNLPSDWEQQILDDGTLPRSQGKPPKKKSEIIESGWKLRQSTGEREIYERELEALTWFFFFDGEYCVGDAVYISPKQKQHTERVMNDLEAGVIRTIREKQE